MIKISIFMLAFLFASVCQAQKKFNTVIRFPAGFDTKKVMIEYDNGRTIKYFPPGFFNNNATISGTLYSRYVTLTIRYFKTATSLHSNEYFLKEGSSSLIFSACGNGDSLAYPFDSCKLSNAIEIRTLPEAKQFKILTEKEASELDKLYENLDKASGKEQDSIQKIIDINSAAFINKEIDFIKQNNDKYYAFWLFQRDLLGFYYIQKHYDTLSGLFASFPAGLRNSLEGREALKLMNGAMFTKKGYKAPPFTAKDISGATIDLNNYRGKYVLLQFWASWCGPCLQEMPAFRKIRDTYSTGQLKMISISIDSDSAAFAKAIVANNISWINIFDNERMINRIYGNKSVPSVYLINREGIIVYSDREEPLEVLNDLLRKSIK